MHLLSTNSFFVSICALLVGCLTDKLTWQIAQDEDGLVIGTPAGSESVCTVDKQQEFHNRCLSEPVRNCFPVLAR